MRNESLTLFMERGEREWLFTRTEQLPSTLFINGKNYSMNGKKFACENVVVVVSLTFNPLATGSLDNKTHTIICF